MRLLIVCLFITHLAFSWGQIGHYTTGYIAEEYLSKKAKKRIAEILKGESLAKASVWMDEIRSDDAYNYTSTWHWVTIPDGMKYEETDKNPTGDIIGQLEFCISAIKADTLSIDKEAEFLKFIIHMVGDIHQPLHVGTGEDRGGNDVKVSWFNEASNLHRVWDTQMIAQKNVGFMELASFLTKPDKETIRKWQSDGIREWAYESMSYRKQVYDLPEDNKLWYPYNYEYFHIVEKRLLQAGVRLAGLLNELYD